MKRTGLIADRGTLRFLFMHLADTFFGNLSSAIPMPATISTSHNQKRMILNQLAELAPWWWMTKK